MEKIHETKLLIRLAAAAAAVALLAVLFLSSSLLSPGEQKITTIRIGVLPDVSEAALRRRYAPLLDHLNRETGLAFELVTPDSYSHLLRLFADREVELAHFGGLTFVKALTHHDAEPLVMRALDLRFTSYFVVRADGPFSNCDDLNCNRLANSTLVFGSKLSTSGHLMPRHFLRRERAIEPDSHFGEVRYSGAHDETAYMIRDGKGDLGVVNGEIYRRMMKDGRLKKGDLRIIWETPPYSNYVWAIHNTLGGQLEIKLRDAFLMLESGDAGHAAILTAMGANGFLPAGAAEFLPLKGVAQRLGLLSLEQL